MNRRTLLLLTTITSSLMAQTDSGTMADEVRTSSELLGESWLSGEGASGDWGGARHWLLDRGIAPYAELTGQFLANVDGGIDDGSAWEGQIDFGLELDFEPMLGWEGGSFFVNAFYFHGNDLSGDYVGDFNAVSNMYTNTDINVYNIFLSQTLWDEIVWFKAGQIASDDDFMVSDSALLFINSAFGPVPVLSGNITAPIYPLAAPGALARIELLEGWHIQGAVYAGDAGPTVPSNHGFDWRTGGSAGWVWFGETCLEYTLLGDGVFKLGGFFATGDFGDFSTGMTENGLGGVYGIFDHQLLDAEHDSLGLSLFVRGSLTPDTDLATVSAYVDGGIVVSGVLFDEDALGLACSHTWFADAYRNASALGGSPVTASETVLELTYAASVTDWFTVQPDMQYIISPHFSDSDALVLGVRCAISL